MKHTTLIHSNMKIGIWGFGATGQSVLSFIQPQSSHIFIYEEGPLTDLQKTMAQQAHAILVEPHLKLQFLEACDLIIPSPGVVIEPYMQTYGSKFVAELDLFADALTIPTIAVTGSVGKTTVVSLLEQILNRLGTRVKAIGNIGMPMLSFTKEQSDYDYAIIELSSFQLEHSMRFNPTIATVTSLLPNHLDRHKTMEAYVAAKGNLLAHQHGQEHTAILHLEDIDALWPFITNQKVQWVGPGAYDDIISQLSDVTFENNLRLVCAILEQLGFELHEIAPLFQTLKRPEHRMELVTTHNNVSFYNDSKSTVIESTLQALTLCKHSPVIVMLGGLSKGVCRKTLLEQLPEHVKYVICFGKEADQLYQWCTELCIKSSSHETLEEAFMQALTKITPGDSVLFSPAGTSYDLFKNFEERGKKFKALVQEFCK